MLRWAGRLPNKIQVNLKIKIFNFLLCLAKVQRHYSSVSASFYAHSIARLSLKVQNFMKFTIFMVLTTYSISRYQMV